MRLLKKLLGYLNRPFDRDPEDFLALRLRYDGGMVWQIADCVLTTSVTGGSGAPLLVDLQQYNITQLAALLALQPGYSVPFVDVSENALRSARCLLDGSGDIDKSNGDHIRGYTSELYAYLDAQASELTIARSQIVEMVEQMSTKTADDEWLDELGGYYGVPRAAGETDAAYGPRIIANVLMPRGNNVAIANAIESISGGIRARIVNAVDVPVVQNRYNGAFNYNGSIVYSSGEVQFSYNLFDALFDIDFGGDNSFDAARVLDLIEAFRDAGTQLRKLSLSGSLVDTVDSSGWQDFVTINGTFNARGSIGTATAVAPKGTASAGVTVSASGATATASAPSGSAVQPTAGSATGAIPQATVAAPAAKVAAGARVTPAGPGTASTSAPSATVQIIQTETLNIDIDPFSDTFASMVARRYNGGFNYNGSQVYDSGDETFSVQIIGS